MAQAVTLKGKTAFVGFFALALARIGLGIIFLWAFLDKTFGLGFATCRSRITDAIEMGCSQAWLQGGSPTEGFLTNATQGPFAAWFQSLAGQAWADWLFMAGLLVIGVGLLCGFALRISAVAASAMLFLMWAAALWPANNPFMDDHMLYIFVLFAIASFARYQKLSCAKWWQNLKLVRKNPWLV